MAEPKPDIVGLYDLHPADEGLVLGRGPLPLVLLQEALAYASTPDDPPPINVNPEDFRNEPFSVAFSAEVAGKLADHIENNALHAQAQMTRIADGRGFNSRVELTFMLSRYHRVLSWLDDMFAIGSGVVVRQVDFSQD